MARIFDDPNGNSYATAVRITDPAIQSFPFRQDLTAILYSIEYVQNPTNFTPTALDTVCPDVGTAYLVEETNPTLRDDGIVKFTRVFATVPANRTEYATGSFAFPAYKTSSASTSFLRPAFTQTVVTKIDYVYVRTSSPGSALTITDRFQPIDDAANKVHFVASDTTPTLVEYQDYVSSTGTSAILKEDDDKILMEDGADALLLEGGGDGAPTYIQSKETRVRRWKGNIWETATRYVYAL